jgi:hypothetical protein
VFWALRSVEWGVAMTPSIATEEDVKALQRELNRVAKPFTAPPDFGHGLMLVARDMVYCATIAYDAPLPLPLPLPLCLLVCLRARVRVARPTLSSRAAGSEQVLDASGEPVCPELHPAAGL